MKRPALRPAVLVPALAALVLVVVAVWLARRRAAEDPIQRAREARIGEAVRVLAYPIEPDLPLVVALLPTDEELKLLTNLALPEAAVESAQAEGGAIDVPFAYGLRCEVLDAAGRVLWQSDYWERTRKTRVLDPGAVVPREEAFLADPRECAADTRAVQLLVGEHCRRGGRFLRVRLAGAAAGPTQDGVRVLARAFRAVDLDAGEARERWWKLGAEKRSDLVARVNALPADLVAPAERERLMRRRWQVIAAEPHGTEEHGTVPVYLTDLFETYTPPPEELRASALAGPGRALAVNLVGPCDLWVEVAREGEREGGGGGGGGDSDGARGAGAAAGEVVHATGLAESGVFVRRALHLDGLGGGRGAALFHAPIPAGAATFVVQPERFAARVRFYVDRVQRLGEVDVARVVGPVGNHWEVRPDPSAVVYFDCGPPEGALESGPAGFGARGEVAVEAEVVPTPGVPVTEVRLACRLPIEPGAPADEEARAALEVEVLDGQGGLIERRQVEGAAPPSRFDSLWREADTGLGLSEPIAFLLRCPPSARRLRVRSRQRALVAFFARLRPEDRRVRVPEDDPKSPAVRTAHVLEGRIRSEAWFYYRPSNQYELGSLGRSVRIRTQRRLFEERDPRERALAQANFARALDLFAAAGEGPQPAPVDLLVEVARAEVDAADDAPRFARPGDRFAVEVGRDVGLGVVASAGPTSRPVPLTLLARRGGAPRGRAGASEGGDGGAAGGAAASASANASAEREVLLLAYVDGRIAHQGPLAPGVAEIDLGAVAAGPHTLRLELYGRARGEEAFAPLEGALAALDLGPFLIDQAVLGPDRRPDAAACVQAKRAFALAEDAPLALDVVKPGPEPLTVNFQALAPPAGGASGAGALRDEVEVELFRFAESAPAAVEAGAAPSAAPGAAATAEGPGVGPGEEAAAAGVAASTDETAGLAGLAAIERRVYSIAREERAGAMTASGARYGRGRAFRLGLDAELPAGRYRIVLRALRGAVSGGPGARAGAEAGGAEAGGAEAGAEPSDAPPLLVRAFVLDPRRAALSEAYFPRFSVEGPLAIEVGIPLAALERAGAPQLRLYTRLQDADAPRDLAEVVLEARRGAERAGGASGSASAPATSAAGPQAAHRIEVPAGLHTVTVGALAAAAGLPARFRFLDRGLEALAGLRGLGAPPAELPLELLPDEVRATWHALAPGGAPLRFALDDEASAEASAEGAGGAAPGEAAERAPVRVSASLVLERVDEAGGAPFTLTARFLDGRGEVVGAEARLEGEAITRRALRDLDLPASVPAEPEGFFAAPPPGARALELGGASGPLLVRVERPRAPGAAAHAFSPSDDERPEGLRVALPDGAGPRWRAVEPEDAARRGVRDERRTLARARALVEAVEPEPPVERHGETLLPPGTEARRRLLEPLARGAIAGPERWSRALYAPLLAGDRARFRVLADPALAEQPAPGAGPGVSASLIYDLGADVPAGELTVRVDGVVRVRAIPLEPQGRLVIPDLAPGERELEIGLGGAPGRFYVNLPPADLAAVRPLRERQVFGLARGAPVLLEVTKASDGESLGLAGALYLEGPPPPGSALAITIEGGARRAGAFTRAVTARRRVVYLHGERAEEVIDLERFAPLPRVVHPFRLALGDDLAAGTYRVRLEMRGVESAEARLALVREGPAARESARSRAVLGGDR